jgi:hypothetical protein
VDTPWVWRELTRRLNSGDLSTAEVDEAITELTSHMKTTSPAGWNQPLSWQADFLAAAIQKRMLSEETFLSLCDAFYGPQPSVKPVGPISTGEVRIPLTVNFGNPWSSSSKLGVEFLWEVTTVRLDGVPMTIRDIHQFSNQWMGNCLGTLPPGEHQFAIEFECAYVDENSLLGINAAQAPVELWPKARKRWKTTVTVPVTVQAIKNE